MSRVLLIGNNAGGAELHDGGSIKIRLYKQCLESLNNEVEIIDLFQWKKHVFKLINDIRRKTAICDVVLIMGGPNGARMLIPLINRINKRFKKRVVYCPLGIGVIENKLKKLSNDETIDFITCKNFYGIKDSKMMNQLKKLDLIIPQNTLFTNLYKKYYSLNNVETLLNFRNAKIINRDYVRHNPLKVIYISRISENKGIMSLIKVVGELDCVELDIFGDIQFDNYRKELFCSLVKRYTNIQYCGSINPNESIKLISKYDLFCLPTKYKGEGTSGAFIESLISGTPALLSSYAISKELIQDERNGFIFEIDNEEDLKAKLVSIANMSNTELSKISKSAQESAKNYIFEYNKERFLELILGNNKKS